MRAISSAMAARMPPPTSWACRSSAKSRSISRSARPPTTARRSPWPRRTGPTPSASAPSRARLGSGRGHRPDARRPPHRGRLTPPFHRKHPSPAADFLLRAPFPFHRNGRTRPLFPGPRPGALPRRRSGRMLAAYAADDGRLVKTDIEGPEIPVESGVGGHALSRRPTRPGSCANRSGSTCPRTRRCRRSSCRAGSTARTARCS